MLSFDFYGNPVAWARTRHVRNCSNKFFNPKEKEKQYLQWQLRSQFREEPLTVPVALDLIFYFPIPKSTSSIKKKQMENGLIAPSKKPDIDNLAKFICDALNMIVYRDDAQIVELRCKKVYSSKPGTSVRVIPLASEKRELLYENCARDLR